MPRRDTSGAGRGDRKKPAGRSGARSTSRGDSSSRSRDDKKGPSKFSRSDSGFSKPRSSSKPFGRSKDDSEKPSGSGNFRSRSQGSSSGEKPFSRSRDDRGESKGPRIGKSRPERSNSSFDKRRSSDSGEKPFRSRDSRDDSKGPSKFTRRDDSKEPRARRSFDGPKEKPYRSREAGEDTKRPSRFGDRSESKEPREKRSDDSDKPPVDRKSFFSKLSRGGKSFTRTAPDAPNYGKPVADSAKAKEEKNSDPDKIRLNRYISNSGVCSRREADELIKMGLVSVNGTVITEMGYKVNRKDVIKYDGKTLRAEKPVYILMNKPKGFLTTTKDPQERNTVMQIIAESVKERVYPVGRLDRNTTGLLLLTNDGELTDKLSHPSYNVKKIYKAELDKPLTKADFEKIREGVRLEEGKAVVDDLAIVSDDGKTVGIEIHIGWNRVIRRIFQSLGYEVVKLDRSVYAGLDKKDLSRGHWRHLTREELVLLKHYK
jgi:23S rRNA pseudouridine2605 synthase